MKRIFGLILGLLLMCGVGLAGDFQYSASPSHVENITVDGVISNPDVPILSISVATESSNHIAVTIQLDENDGTNIAELFLAHVWLSDTAGGAETGTTPDGDFTATTGTLLEEITADERQLVISDANGTIVMDVEDDDADNDWYLVVEFDGKIFVSDVIDHAT
jgi:hypothetical protein